jgi:transposase
MPARADVPVSGHEAKYAEGVQLRYNYRLYPAPGQRTALARAFGCARVVFNDGLRLREEAHQAGLPYVTDAELSARLAAVRRPRSGRGWRRFRRWCSSRPWRT